jgi:hypothetical protein
VSAPRRGPGRALLLLALLALLLGTAAMLLRGLGGGPVVGGPHRVERVPLPKHYAPDDEPWAPGSGRPGAVPADAGRAGRARVRVRAVRAEGRAPVPGARIVLRDLFSEWAGVADASGEVVFQGVAEGVVTASAFQDGCFGIPNRWTLPAADEGPVDLLLAETLGIEGVVAALSDGRPVPGAVVAMEGYSLPLQPSWNRNGRAPRMETVTDAEGRFRLEGGSAGVQLYLKASAEGFVSRTLYETPPAGVRGPHRVRLLLESAARIVGVVRDSFGNPVAAAVVMADEAAEHSTVGDCRTAAADGTFILEGLPTGGVFRVRARKEGYAPSPAVEVYLAPGAVEARAELRLAESGGLLVTWESVGRTAPAWVQARIEGEGADAAITTQFGRGRDRILGLRPGKYRVGLYGNYGGPGAWGEADVEVAVGAPTPVHVRLEEDVCIQGMLVDAAGRHLGGTAAMIRIEEESPGDGGREGRIWGAPEGPDVPSGVFFVFHGLRPGSVWRILAKSRLAANWTVVATGVRAPARDLAPVFEPGGPVFGTIELPKDAARSTYVKILYRPAGADESRESAHINMWGGGRFRLDGLPPGAWEIRATGEGLSGGPVTATVPAAGGVDVGVIALATADGAPLPVRGRLLVEGWSAGGTPLAGRAVTVTRADRGAVEIVPRQTDRRGRWQAALPGGKYHIVIQSPDLSAAAEGDVEVPEGGEANLVLRAGR